ncbi:YecA family protein [Paenibacillus sp. MBLB4367]|uniref:YecA family protein n=1 Tax=Paenibacillus sp. MBLB4367 TaxID=3384767 RepID=UPI0039081BAA
MNKQLSAKDQKTLLNALESAKEASRQMAAKQEDKRWSEIETPLPLIDALVRLTKNDLTDIRVNLDIKGASTLKKQELAEVLAQQIPGALPALLISFDEDRYKVLKHIAERGGHAYLPLDSSQIGYFTDRGLLFPGTFNGQKTLVMPVEIAKAFTALNHNSYRETLRRNTEWIKLTYGMLHYYGMLNLDQLETLLTPYTGEKPKPQDYLDIILDAIKYDQGIRHDAAGFYHSRVWNAEDLIKGHAFRSSLTFYPFTKAQLLKAGEPNFVDRNPAYEAFVSFIIKNYPYNREQADQLAEECVYAIRIDQTPSQLFQYLQQFLNIATLEATKALMDHLVLLHNNTKQWTLKGYSPDELSAARNPAQERSKGPAGEVIDFASKKKIGRNDPCPCGSGMKFKKCCGK